MRDQFNNTLENIERQMKHRPGSMDEASKDNNILLAQLKSLTMEKNYLAEELSKSQLARQEAESNNDK